MKNNKIYTMIFRSSIVITLIFGVMWAKQFNSEPKMNPEKEALQLQGLIQTVQYVHFDPKPIDDKMSQTVYKTFLERLDFQKRFFTQEEINRLSTYENSIDDQIKMGDFEFFNETSLILEHAIVRAKENFNLAIQQSFDFDTNDSFETNGDKRVFSTNAESLKNEWMKLIAFEVLNNWVDKIESQKDIQPSADEPLDTEEQLKEKAIKDIKKRFEDWFERLAKLRREDRLETYLGSIANYFDPHTDYFSPKEKQDFDINMGGKLEGIGARLQNEGDYTKIFNIIVGGPAWKTKKIEDNDLIIKVTQKGQEPVDIAGMRVDDVVQMIRGKKGTVVILTIKKKDNSIIEVEIERDEVQLEESKAKSVILNIAGKVQNVGYIHLPKFYSSFENEGGNSCALDVAQEIKKLKDAQVNGIILDLRNNSGGSLNDVVDMSGLFIEEGPIVQVKGREGKPYLHSDKDKSVLYTGPLVIMVNQFSASASEIIAAAMQDYSRALIVGSSSTFGKGTVQRFYDLDRGIRGYDHLKPLGSVKTTVQKFYRIDGGSTQLKGVIPDIVYPDSYQFIEMGEKEYDNPLSWTEIEPVKFSQNVASLDNKLIVINKSNERVSANDKFKKIQESALSIKENKDLTLWPMNKKIYMQKIEERKTKSKEYEDLLDQEIPYLDIKNLDVDLAKINLDESNMAKNQEFIKDLKKDIYLEETLYVLRDMIQNEKSFTQWVDKIGTY